MEDSTRTASWATHFDILLRDQAGLATFTEFLKKAYCQENIYFWIKCEEYKLMNDDQRRVGAARIYDDHVDLSASEQINIDENTRLAVEKELSLAPRNLFDHAQKHIYIMLQQDSYRRFFKSDLYRQAVLAESQQKPFPFCGQEVVKLVASNDTVKISKHQGKTSDSKGRPSLIPIPSTSSSKRKSFFASKGDKKKKKKEDSIDRVEKESDLKTLRTTAALPDVEKKEEKSSGNSSGKGLFGFFRRRSLGNAGKGKSFTQRSVSSPTINKIRILPESRPIHPSNTYKGASDLENCGPIPSVPERALRNSEATYHDVVQTLCAKENWNGVIRPLNDDNDDDFDNAKYTRATVLRRRTDGINPGGIISIREQGSTAYDREASASSSKCPLPLSQSVSSMEQRLGPNRLEKRTDCIDSLQQQLSGHRSDSSFPPPAALCNNQLINLTSFANGNSNVTTDRSQKKKHHMSFSTLFPGRKSSKEKNFSRRSIDTATVKKELTQLRRSEDFGAASSRIIKRHSLETLIEF